MGSPVEVRYGGKVVWRFEADDSTSAVEKAESGGHSITLLSVRDGRTIRLKSVPDPKWVEVSETVLRTILNKQKRENVCYTGSTFSVLREKYGEGHVIHKMGVGFFRRRRRGHG